MGKSVNIEALIASLTLEEKVSRTRLKIYSRRSQN